MGATDLAVAPLNIQWTFLGADGGHCVLAEHGLPHTVLPAQNNMLAHQLACMQTSGAFLTWSLVLCMLLMLHTITPAARDFPTNALRNPKAAATCLQGVDLEYCTLICMCNKGSYEEYLKLLLSPIRLKSEPTLESYRL